MSVEATTKKRFGSPGGAHGGQHQIFVEIDAAPQNLQACCQVCFQLPRGGTKSGVSSTRTSTNDVRSRSLFVTTGASSLASE